MRFKCLDFLSSRSVIGAYFHAAVPSSSLIYPDQFVRGRINWSEVVVRKRRRDSSLRVEAESASARLATRSCLKGNAWASCASEHCSGGHNRAPQMITPPVDICLMDLIISQFPPQIDFMPGRRALCDLARKLSRAEEANGHLEKSIDVKFPLLERKGL